MRDFRTLQAWQRSHSLALAVYKITRPFPPEEMYGLRSQLRRSSASVPTNIAESCGTDGGLDMARFLQMAMRSASEADYQLLLARDLGYVSDDAYEPIEKEVAVTKRVLNALIRKVRSDARRQPRANG